MKQWIPKKGDKGLTRGGEPYEILFVAPPHLTCVYPIQAAIGDQLRHFDPLGRKHPFGCAHAHDLLAPTRTLWMNIYEGGKARYHASEELALENARAADVIAVALPVVVKA